MSSFGPTKGGVEPEALGRRVSNFAICSNRNQLQKSAPSCTLADQHAGPPCKKSKSSRGGFCSSVGDVKVCGLSSLVLA